MKHRGMTVQDVLRSKKRENCFTYMMTGYYKGDFQTAGGWLKPSYTMLGR